MKKNILLALIMVSLVVSLSAFTWQGQLDAGAEVSGPTEELLLEQTDRLSVLLNAPFGSNNSMSITAKAFYEFGFEQTLTPDSTAELSHIADLEILQYTLGMPLSETSDLSLQVGRFPITDLTGIIVEQPMDGLQASYVGSSMLLKTFVGFTGLLNAHTVSINAAQNENILSSVYTLAAPFVLADITFNMQNLFANQDIFAEVFAAVDVSGIENPDNRIYATAALSGPIANDILFYSLSSTVGISQGVTAEWNISNLSTFELSTFLPFTSSLLSWKTIFATSEADSSFQTFTVETATIDDSLEYAGHVKSGLVATLRPIDSLLLFLEPSVVLNVMDESKEKGYAGFQWMFASRWKATSDLQLIASAGQFLSADTSIQPNLKAEVKLSFAF